MSKQTSDEPTLPPSPGKKTMLLLSSAIVGCLACMLCAIAGAGVNASRVAPQATAAPPAQAPSTTPPPAATPSPTASATPTVAMAVAPPTSTASATLTSTQTPTPSQTPTRRPTRTWTPTRTSTATRTPATPPDTVPPQIANVAATPNPIYYGYTYCGSSLTVTATVTDNKTLVPSAVLNYYFWQSNSIIPSSPLLTLTMARQTVFRFAITSYYSATVDISTAWGQYMGSNDGILQYWVTASDDAGNQASSARQSVDVRYCPEPIR